MKSTINYLAFI